MPNLSDLELTVRPEPFKQEIVDALARGPRITALTLSYHPFNGWEAPGAQTLLYEANPWLHLESVIIKHAGTSAIPHNLLGTVLPKHRLTRLAVLDGTPAEVSTLSQHSKETLSHLSLVGGLYDASTSSLGLPTIKNIRSLTLGETLWSEELLKIMHSFNNLKELRFIGFMLLNHSFPSHLPDTIEHLLVTVPLYNSDGEHRGPDMMRPALLKSFTAVVVEGYTCTYRNCRIYAGWDNWAKKYAAECNACGITADIRKTESKGGYTPDESKPPVDDNLCHRSPEIAHNTVRISQGGRFRDSVANLPTSRDTPANPIPT